MNFLSRMDSFVGKKIVWFTLSCVVLSVAIPNVTSKLIPYTSWLFAFMTFSSSLSAGFHDLKKAVLHPLPILAVLLILHAILPVLVLILARLLFAGHPYLVTGLVLEFSVPTAVASLMWVSMSQGDLPLTLSIVLLDTLLSPFLIPLSLKLLVGSVVHVAALSMMESLLFMVGIPAVAAMSLFQVTGGRIAKTLQPKLSPFSKIALLLIILANVSKITPYLRNMTGTLFLVLAVVFVMCLLGYFLGWQTAGRLKKSFPAALAISLTSGMRNNNAGAVLALQYFPGEALFPIVITSLFMQATASVVISVLRRTKLGREALLPSEAPPAGAGADT